MPHLPVVANRGLPVIMKVPVRSAGDLLAHPRNVLTQDVDHHGRLKKLNLWEWPIADCSVVDGKLGEVAGFNRVMPRIMWAGCQLINVDLTSSSHEHFNP